MKNFLDKQQKEVTVFGANRWNNDRVGARQPRQEDFTQQGVVTCLKCHYMAEVHKTVKGVLRAIVHLEFWQGKVRRGLLVQDGQDK